LGSISTVRSSKYMGHPPRAPGVRMTWVPQKLPQITCLASSFQACLHAKGWLCPKFSGWGRTAGNIKSCFKMVRRCTSRAVADAIEREPPWNRQESYWSPDLDSTRSPKPGSCAESLKALDAGPHWTRPDAGKTAQHSSISHHRRRLAAPSRVVRPASRPQSGPERCWGGPWRRDLRRNGPARPAAQLPGDSARPAPGAASGAFALGASFGQRCDRRWSEAAAFVEARAALLHAQLPRRARRSPGGSHLLLPERLGPEPPERGHPRRRHRRPHLLKQRHLEERWLVAVPRQRGRALLVRVGVLVVAEGEQLWRWASRGGRAEPVRVGTRPLAIPLLGESRLAFPTLRARAEHMVDGELPGWPARAAQIESSTAPEVAWDSMAW